MNRFRRFLVQLFDLMADCIAAGIDDLVDLPPPPPGYDYEGEACAEIAEVLRGLSLEQRDRVLRWAQQRYIVDDDAMKTLYAQREIGNAARRHALLRAEMKFRAEIADIYTGPFEDLAGGGTSH